MIKEQLDTNNIEILKSEADLLSLVTKFDAPGYVLVPVENTDVKKVLDYSAFKEGSIIKIQTDIIKLFKNFAKGGYYKVAIEQLPREQEEEIYKERMSGTAENITNKVKEAKIISSDLIYYVLDEVWMEINKRELLNYKDFKPTDNSTDRYINKLEKVVFDQLAENDEFISAWFDREEIKDKHIAYSEDFLYDFRCKALFLNEKLMKKAIEKQEGNVRLLAGDTDKKDNLDMVLNCLLANTGDKDKDFETNKRRLEEYISYHSTGFHQLLSKSKYFDKRFFEVLATYIPERFHRAVLENMYCFSDAVYNALFDFARSDYGLNNKNLFAKTSSAIRFDYKRLASSYKEQDLYEAYKNYSELISTIPAETIIEWDKRIEEEKYPSLSR